MSEEGVQTEVTFFQEHLQVVHGAPAGRGPRRGLWMWLWRGGCPLGEQLLERDGSWKPACTAVWTRGGLRSPLSQAVLCWTRGCPERLLQPRGASGSSVPSLLLPACPAPENRLFVLHRHRELLARLAGVRFRFPAIFVLVDFYRRDFM